MNSHISEVLRLSAAQAAPLGGLKQFRIPTADSDPSGASTQILIRWRSSHSPRGAGPEDIAAAPNGAMWFTQFGAGNIARITSDGTISEGRSVRNSGPLGITVAPNGDPWYAMPRANKIATLQVRSVS
jgi:streptogramin lyase